MKHKQLISSIILMAMLAGLASCGNTDGNDQTAEDTSTADGTETTVPETEEDTRASVPDDLPDIDLEGYEYRVFMRTTEQWTKEMFIDELTGDVVSDAVYERNRKVQERFNTKLKLITTDDDYGLDAVNSILANEDAYDLIMAHGHAAFNYANQMLCMNWNSDLPNINLDQAWWDQNARESFEICGQLYVMIGDISYLSLANSSCVYFNQNLFEEYGIDTPYQTVLDGNWTFDEFAKIAKQGSKDLNGDGQLKPEDDQYGYVTQVWAGPIFTLYSGGGRIMQTNDKGELELTLNTERNIEIYRKFFDLMKNDSCYLELNPSTENNGPLRNLMFEAGHALMMESNVSDTSRMRDMKDDFGIIPSPKFDSTDKNYAANVDAGTSMLVVPVTVGNPEYSSIVLEALCAEGYRSVIPAYYEVALQKKYTRDDVSVRMIDIIKDNRVFDLGYYFAAVGGELSFPGTTLATYPDQNFSSFYASKEKAVLTAIKKANAKFAKANEEGR